MAPCRLSLVHLVMTKEPMVLAAAVAFVVTVTAAVDAADPVGRIDPCLRDHQLAAR